MSVIALIGWLAVMRWSPEQIIAVLLVLAPSSVPGGQA
ncbi:hypothetical protein ABH926_006382 [Catenulispora sp. GP43]